MNLSILLKELSFKAIRSSGPGGQHVNKTSSKVEVSLNILASKAFSTQEIDVLRLKLASKISEKGVLILQCDESRSQHRNKKIVIDRLITLLKKQLKVAKPRKKSKPSRSAIEKRLTSKKKQALKKSNRRNPLQG